MIQVLIVRSQPDMSEMVKLRSYGPSTDTIGPYDDDETA